MRKLNVAVVGATGLVGQTILNSLAEREFPINELVLLASHRSKGKVIEWKGRSLVVQELTDQSFDQPIDLALFAAGGSISKRFIPIALEKGVVVVDNSSAYRMDEAVPLIVPEVNPDAITHHQGLIANPNCSTIQSVLPLGALSNHYSIKRVVFSTYQSVSGSGQGGIDDLERVLKGETPKFYPYPIAFNVIPHIDVFLDNGYTKEEMKMVEETRKILNHPSLLVTATTVRVPVVYGHAVSANIEFNEPYQLDHIKEILNNHPGIKVMDNLANNEYPTPLQVAGQDTVYVGRIRRDESCPNGLNLWIVADNIRKGAATNTVQIAELLLRRDLI